MWHLSRGLGGAVVPSSGRGLDRDGRRGAGAPRPAGAWSLFPRPPAGQSESLGAVRDVCPGWGTMPGARPGQDRPAGRGGHGPHAPSSPSPLGTGARASSGGEQPLPPAPCGRRGGSARGGAAVAGPAACRMQAADRPPVSCCSLRAPVSRWPSPAPTTRTPPWASAHKVSYPLGVRG